MEGSVSASIRRRPSANGATNRETSTTSVFATPAVGDVQGNGQQDIVFGSYDHYIYALNPYGKLLPGFPIDRADTIWSSPALVDYAHNGRDDIIMGGDASGLAGLDGKPCFGGWLTDYRYSPRTRSPHLIWQVCVGQTVWSSPAIGVINSTHRLAVVVGTSFNPAYRESRATDELFAYYLANRAPVPGWPVKTVGPSFGSPAIASLTPGGRARGHLDVLRGLFGGARRRRSMERSGSTDLAGSGHTWRAAVLVTCGRERDRYRRPGRPRRRRRRVCTC